jgi:hypothetical protein
MRVLFCLDGTNVEQVSKATEMLLATQSLTLGMLYVIDTGPRKDIEHTRERFLRPPGPSGSREDEMHQAEQDILNEGLRYLLNAEKLQRQKRPEREIVNVAAEWQADLVIICPAPNTAANPLSIGRTCRPIRPRPCSLSGLAGETVGTRAISYCAVSDR